MVLIYSLQKKMRSSYNYQVKSSPQISCLVLEEMNPRSYGVSIYESCNKIMTWNQNKDPENGNIIF